MSQEQDPRESPDERLNAAFDRLPALVRDEDVEGNEARGGDAQFHVEDVGLPQGRWPGDVRYTRG